LSPDARPHGPLVWVHGASVGEVLAAAALIEKLRALNLRILLTSGTVTSAAIVAKRFPADIIHQYVPYDSPRYVARFLDHWRPSLALFIESDLWPNLILSSAARRLPMVLINGRMSHRSFPRWRRVAGTIAALLGRFFPSLLSVIVPRHPGRGEAVARAIAASGLHVALRSREESPTATTDVYVADTMGELGLFYRLAPIVFMGGSLVPHGGQNPVEAVKLGASIVHGPHVFNFSDVYETLDGAGGARRADAREALVKQLGQLLADPAAREAQIRASERVVEELGGAVARRV